MLSLGIETSCDETSIAVVTDKGEVLSNIILSQIEEHKPYGGVVPEIAARSHLVHIRNVYEKALAEAAVTLADINIISATAGPGLIGGLIVGLMFGKSLAAVSGKPFIAVNHLEGHALTVRFTDKVKFPYLLFLASGGHCQFLLVQGVGDYVKLGGTLDDAIGEAFDKTAKLLGLGYPGGPKVEQEALKGDKHAYNLPLPLVGRDGCDFSFSGLKTAVRNLNPEARNQKPETTGNSQLVTRSSDTQSLQYIPNVCASFQHTVCQILKDRTRNAITMTLALNPKVRTLVVAGGVAANQAIRQTLNEIAGLHDMQMFAPPLRLCTDNAAMIAWAGLENYKAGNVSSLSSEPRARWPLMNLTRS